MKNEFDYDEIIMHQHTRHIFIPNTPRTPNSQPLNQPFFTSKQHNQGKKNHLPLQNKQQLKQEKQTSLVNRVSQILLKKQVKINAIKQQQLKKTQKQCTFKPKTISNNKKNANVERRTLDEFLQQQAMFQKKVDNKRQIIKNDIQSKNSNDNFFQPKINKKSKQMTISRQKDNTNGKCIKTEYNDDQDTKVFDRLYALKDKENQHPNIVIDLFIPQINQKSKKMIRPIAVENLLYQDAIRRQQRLTTQPTNRSNNNSFMKTDRSVSINNQRYAANKFIKEYCFILQKLNFYQQKQAKNKNINPISYMMFTQILKHLHFINLNQNQQEYTPNVKQNNNNIERMLVNEAYQFIANYSVNVRNVCIFLLAIIGIFNVDPINFQKQLQNQKQMMLGDQDGKKIQTYFQCFKINRLSNGQKSQKIIIQESQQQKQKLKQQFSFHPKINKTSSELAQKNRSRMIQEAELILQKYPQLKKNLPPKDTNGKVNNIDVLILKDMVRQLKVKKQKEQKEKLNLAQCTFKPLTKSICQNKQSTACGAIAEQSLGEKKSLQLYKQHKDRVAYRQYLYSTKRDPQEQSLKHCTFSPSISPFNLQSSHHQYDSNHLASSFIINDKNSNQQMYRSSLKSKSIKTSYPSKKRFITSPTIQLQNQTLNEFDVNVSFGQYVQCLRLKIGDYEGIDQIVKFLSEKYELQVEQIVRLHELLRKQMQLARLSYQSNTNLS